MKKIATLAAVLLCSAAAAGNDTPTQNIEFTSHDTTIAGSILFPKGDIHAAVVFVHGSGPQTRPTHWAQQFAADGIAALVYDKRGVGASGGTYEGKQAVTEKNIRLLADDALAALQALRTHPKLTDVPLGLTGISQAGWIVPVAAEVAEDVATENAGPVDFMVLWSGPVSHVSEEDIYSKYTKDLDGKRVPPYQEALDARLIPYVWPSFLGKDTDPSDSLSMLDIPGLWIFGARDGSVPVDLSIERLDLLIDDGKPYEYALMSAVGHNNMSETFSLATDWIKRTVGKR